jgi:hypothetical protein
MFTWVPFDAKKYIRRHLDRLKSGWLQATAEAMEEAVTSDWHTWEKSADS